MKKLLVTTVLVMFFQFCHSQEFNPLKSPDVSAFMSVNYLPINEYTGKAPVDVPLYTINLDGLEIPISLSYNTGGVKINSAASRVGLNWSLNAGGMINKEIQGYSDFEKKWYWHAERGETVYTRLGYLSSPDPNQVNPVAPSQHRDTRPDLFYVAAPGLTTKFTHNPDRAPFELSNTAALISRSFADAASDYVFRITPTNGFVYSFNDWEYNVVLANALPYDDLTNELEDAPWDENLSDAEVEDLIHGEAIWTTSGRRETLPVIHISAIKNPVTNRTVKFFYKKNNVVDNDRRIERKFSIGSDHSLYIDSQVNYEHDYSQENMIDKIVFPDGVIDFYYEGGRLDIRGGKKLTKIEVRNNTGKLIKAIAFEYDYFTTPGCTDPQCYRLKLNAIKFYDSQNNALPGYTFHYNSTSLPKRYSLNQDFTGLYNGNHGLVLKNYKPILYVKENQGRSTFLPFNAAAQYALNGNASLAANLTYAKAGALERIVYPTGGYSIFTYGLNSFKYGSTVVQGGGLRIESQSLYDANNTLQMQKNYDYNAPDGLTSGELCNPPQFVTNDIISSSTAIRVNQVGRDAEIANGFFVGYSQCKIYESGNGYTINTYTSPSEFPNIYPANYVSSYYPDKMAVLVSQGLAPNIYQDMDVKRGMLKQSRTFNDQGSLLKSVTNSYSYYSYGEFNVSEHILQGIYASPFANGSQDPSTQYDSKLVSESYLLTSSTETEVNAATALTKNTALNYNASRPMLTEKEVSDSEGTVSKQVSYYPFDPEVSSSPNMSSLVARNILPVVKSTFFKGSLNVKTNVTKYGDFGGYKYLPNSQQESFGSEPLVTTITFSQFDKRGNLVEYSQRDGTKVVSLWGYNYQFKVADVVNSTYAQVLAALGISDLDVLQGYSETQLVTAISTLRSQLAGAQVHSYLHVPLVGVTSIVDPNGKNSTVEYDSYGRLQLKRDFAGNIVSKYNYNYRAQATVTLASVPLELELLLDRSDFYHLEFDAEQSVRVLRANVKGGTGDYQYTWKQAGTSNVIGNQSYLELKLACGTEYSVDLTVTDRNGTSLSSSKTVHATRCGDSFYGGDIVATPWNGRCTIVDAEGGSGRFSYTWHSARSFIQIDPQTVGFSNSSTTTGLTVTVQLEIKDLETGLEVNRVRSFTIPKAPNVPDGPSCFVSGTKITMSDGSPRNIEEVSVGEKIMTYNLASQKLEEGIVEQVVSPLHRQLVVITFDNGVSNINTPDHPYYIKGKGWSSCQPDLTLSNYGLNVSKIIPGDSLLFFNGCETMEVKVSNIESKEEEVMTYNLSKVSKNHNFFANGVLVHNKSNE